MRIVIPDDYQNAVRSLASFRRVDGHDVTVYTDTERDPGRLVERLRDAEAIVAIRERTPITAALIERLPHLKIVSSVGGVGGHIDVAACTRRGIAVADGGSVSSHSTVELCWALILASMRHLTLEDRRIREGRWQTTIGIGWLHGRTLGIYGYGKLGQMTAKIAPAFGMRVLVFGRARSIERARADGFEIAQDKAALFTRSDVLSIHLRLSAETRGMVTYDDLASMKPDALLVNVSRAGLIQKGALEKALRAGRPGWAAVDVFDDEPVVGANDPLTQLDNIVLSPHLGYVDRDSYERYFDAALGNIAEFAAGRPVNIVNPEVLGQARAG